MQIGLLDIDCHASKKKWGSDRLSQLGVVQDSRLA